MTRNIIFWERYKSKSFAPYVLRSIVVSPQSGWFEELAAVEAAGVNGCQGTPWSEELNGKELHGALGGECDLERKGSAVSCTLSTRNQPTFQASTSMALC